jgi:hypothetical protein
VGVYVAWATLTDLARALRRYLRHPQFGMRNLFSLTVVFALACAMLRWLKIDDVYGTATAGLVLAVWAAGIVCGVEFAINDFASQYGARRERRHDRPLELWNDATPAQAPLGGAPPAGRWMASAPGSFGDVGDAVSAGKEPPA